jgi:hypothetical protein
MIGGNKMSGEKISRLGSISRRGACLFGAVTLAGSIALFSGAAPLAAASSAHSIRATHVEYGNFLTSNWGGWISAGSSGAFTSATASWIEPPVTCLSDDDLYAPWVGIDGWNNDTVEQTGVQTACSTGKPKYSAWYEMYPAAPVYYTNPVSVNDSFTATVTASGHSYTLVMKDNTKGWTESVTKTLNSSKNATAEAVIEAPGGMPEIASVDFTNVKFNGSDLDTFSLTKSKVDGTGSVVYVPRKITDGDNFDITPKG